MPSIIEGYNYDIFISYRQKDNKHDGWVTEFVNQLEGELEATFKEDISIYFDENPSDGLLETHSVDKSLESKLRCLIFIPIISQTYCDPNSFAWQHEFCAFNNLAKEDKFGRDIRLSSGNVTSRILPVKIHDLDPEDKSLLETELGGVLRSIEFIYNSAGVNRPLNPSDNPDKNLNKTYYRDQINKVANAVKEIITALRKQSHHPEEISKQYSETKSTPKKDLKTKIIAGTLILLALIVLGYFFVPKLFKSSEQLEKSIAILPFRNDSPDQENAQFTNGTMEAILDNLCKIEDLRVISRTSVEQYRNTTKSITQIAKELNVSYILEGSGQKYGNDIKLTVQLIDAVNDKHIWSSPYERKFDDIFIIQSEIAQTIASEIKAIITPEEKELIEKVPTSNLTAYDLYFKANEFLSDYMETDNLNFYQKAVNFYQTALEIDSSFAKAYSGLAKSYYLRYFYETFFKENFLDSSLVLINIALSFDDQLEEAYYLKGLYYDAIGNNEKAIINYDKALVINPNYYLAYYSKGRTLTWVLYDFVKGIGNFNKALTLTGTDERPSLLRNLGRVYLDVGFIEKAKYYYNEAKLLDENKALDLSELAWVEFSVENFKEALKLMKAASEIDSAYSHDLVYYIASPDLKEEAYLMAKEMVEYYKKSGALNLVESHRVGYAFWKMGKYKEADYYFKQQINYGTESIKLSRDIGQRKAAQYDMAATFAFLGDKIKAYQYLDEFNNKSFYPLWWISLAKHDPLFESIRNEGRFQKILQNMEAKHQAEHERVRKWLEENNML